MNIMKKMIEFVAAALILMMLPFMVMAQDVVDAPDVADVVEAPEDVAGGADVADPASDAVSDVVEGDVADPAPAPASKGEIETAEDAAEAVDGVVAAFQNGAWAVGIGLILSLIAWIVRRFVLAPVTSRWAKAAPWVAAGASLLAAVGTSLALGIVWWQALIQGVVAVASAGGLWAELSRREKKAA